MTLSDIIGCPVPDDREIPEGWMLRLIKHYLSSGGGLRFSVEFSRPIPGSMLREFVTGTGPTILAALRDAIRKINETAAST